MHRISGIYPQELNIYYLLSTLYPALPDQTRKKKHITNDKGKKQTEAASIIHRANICYLHFTYQIIVHTSTIILRNHMKTALFYRDSIYIFDILIDGNSPIHRDSTYILGILLPIPLPTYDNKQTETALFTGTQNTLLAYCS